MPKLTINLSNSAVNYVYTIKFRTGLDENKIIYLMIKYFKNNPHELDKLLKSDNEFDNRIKHLIGKIKTNSSIH